MAQPSEPVTNVATPQLSDEDAVTRVCAGETAWFEILMRRYNQRLFRIARGILRNDSEAEDAVQQAYISAYEHLRQFAGQARFSTWLTRIAIHAALARARSLRRRAEVDVDAQPHEETMTSNPEQLTAGREMTTLLERLVDELPEHYRVVFMMREVQQLATAETAECLEVSEDVVKVRLHRAKSMLRRALAARVDTAAPDAFVFLGERCDRIVASVMARLTAPTAAARPLRPS
jgi:RNA polymerase sigma-70 factor (ECF subfamily)